MLDSAITIIDDDAVMIFSCNILENLMRTTRRLFYISTIKTHTFRRPSHFRRYDARRNDLPLTPLELTWAATYVGISPELPEFRARRTTGGRVRYAFIAHRRRKSNVNLNLNEELFHKIFASATIAPVNPAWK